MVSVAVARLPAAVILLLLEALFMKISGVRLALTWPCRLCLLRVLLCVSLCYKLSPFQAHWERWHCTCFLRPACLFTVHVGNGSSPLSCAVFLPPPLLEAFLLLITGQCCCSCQPPYLFTVHMGSGSFSLSCGVFLPLPLSQAFRLLVAGCVPPLPPELLRPTGLVYLQSQEGFPSPNFQHSVRPTFFPTCLYCFYCLLVTFSSLPGWKSVCPGGYAALAQGCLWEYCSTVKLTLSTSPKPSGCGRLAAWGPSLFLCLMWSGDSLHQLEVWRGQSFVSSQWFCLQSVSPASLQDFTIGGSLSVSSL
jgi:hypothetical protein